MFIRKNLTTGQFAKIFTPALIIYSFYFFLRLDWHFYESLAQTHYQPIGVFSFFNLPWPGLGGINALLGIAAISGALSLFGIYPKVSTLAFAGAIFFLDGFHNMFGFVDARIHMVFFLVAAAFMQDKPDEPLGKSKAFMFCEVVFILVYFQSGLAKLLDSGLAWGLQGGTLQIALIRQQMELGVWLSRHTKLVIALSTMVLMWEILFPVLYFLNKRRIYLYITSILFHIGTFLLMEIDFFHLWVFSLAMLVAKIDWKYIYETYSARSATI